MGGERSVMREKKKSGTGRKRLAERRRKGRRDE